MSQSKFFSKMKKKPELQSVLDNIQDYDEEKIEALTGSHFPRWIKDELILRLSRGGQLADDVAEDIARQMNEAAAKKLQGKE